MRTDRAIAVLQSLEAALTAGDADAAAAVAGTEARDELRGIAGNARELRVRGLSLRLVEADRALSAGAPAGEWSAAVEASWRFAGHDTSPVRAEITATFSTDAQGAVTIVGFGAGNRRLPLWLSGPVQVRSGPGWLLLADRAVATYVPLVRRALPPVRAAVVDWDGTLVVEVPASAAELDHTLGAEPGTFANIAAVTTQAGDDRGPRAPVHVFVNPDVLGGLKAAGAQVVMTHEATHVATDAVLAQMPLWLLEGYADHVALRGTTLPVSVTAGQIIRRVREDGAPETLPGAERFNPREAHLGAWYEAAWRAVEVLAAAGDEATLLSLYRRCAQGADLDVVLRDLYGFGVEELTSRWQADLTRISG